MSREDIPTAAQIAAIDDVGALRDIADALLLRIDHVEAQLEVRGSGDQAWADRATRALAVYRFCRRKVMRRLAHLLGGKRAESGFVPRDREDNHELTNRVLDGAFSIDFAQLVDDASSEGALVAVLAAVRSLEDDRADEIALAPLERDEKFLGAVAAALKMLHQVRVRIDGRQREIRKARALDDLRARERERERMFIEAAREVLDRETFLRIWAVVDMNQGVDAA